MGDTKAPFSIVTATPFPGLLHLTLDTYFIMLSVKLGGITYHFLSLWYDSTWYWTSVSRTICKHSTHLANGPVSVNKYCCKPYIYLCYISLCYSFLALQDYFYKDSLCIRLPTKVDIPLNQRNHVLSLRNAYVQILVSIPGHIYFLRLFCFLCLMAYQPL